MTNRVYYNSQLTSPLEPFVLSSALSNCSRNMHSQGNVRPRKYRGSRSGKLVQEKRMRYSYNIQTLVSHPSSRSKFAYSRKTSNCSNHSNLTKMPRKPMERRNTPTIRPVHFCLLNARSVNNKTLIIKDLVAVVWKSCGRLVFTGMMMYKKGGSSSSSQKWRSLKRLASRDAGSTRNSKITGNVCLFRRPVRSIWRLRVHPPKKRNKAPMK